MAVGGMELLRIIREFSECKPRGDKFTGHAGIVQGYVFEGSMMALSDDCHVSRLTGAFPAKQGRLSRARGLYIY